MIATLRAAYTRRPLLRMLSGAAAITLGLGLALASPQGRASAAAEPPQLSELGTTSSAVTVSGAGRFSPLKVTVGQTRDLVNQSVLVTWSGGAPTAPTTDRFAYNYLQIMQCWGDQPTGPAKNQCAFGARAATDDRGGDFAATRQVGGTGIIDPLEDSALFRDSTPAFAPFTSVTGEVADPGNTNQFYDGNTTNEITYARTNPNGTGSMQFEAQTGNENAGLGCGGVNRGAVHKCWLVIVPRSDTEVDGRVISGNGGNGGGRENMISTSPLSETNWRHRIVVQMDFSPLASGCPLGKAERRTLGDELVTEAMVRWQPGLCSGGTVYGFNQVVSSTANRKLATDNPGLVFVTSKPTETLAPQAYAPVAVSALGIGLAVDTTLPANPKDSVAAQDGLPLSTVNLTQRVVAKLLTQSYQTAVPPGGRYLTMNPRDLSTDPDFLKDNPHFRDLKYDRITDIMVPGSSTADYVAIWDWVLSDAEARSFLAGYPDPWGARVNPFYQGNTTASDSFPRLDPYCQRFGLPIAAYAQQSPLCALDAFPYTNDLHDSARSSSRGDSLARNRWNLALENSETPPGYKRAPVQLPGRRSLLSLVDSATAARFGLPMASLRNSSGRFVAPSVPSVSAAVNEMTRDASTGMRTLSPTAARGSAYPLARISYAATVPSKLDVAEAKELGALIRYAVGPGQQQGSEPGMLPVGYVPLSAALRTEALAAAGAAERRESYVAPVTDPSDTSNTPSPAASPGVGGTGGALPVPSVTATPTLPTPTSPLDGPGAVLASAPHSTSPTPGFPVGLIRYVIVAALIVGGLSLFLAPALPWVARRFARSPG